MKVDLECLLQGKRNTSNSKNVNYEKNPNKGLGGIGKKTKTKNKRIKSNPNNKQFTLAIKMKDELSYLSSNCHQVGTKGQ